jgi:ribonuclease-3
LRARLGYTFRDENLREQALSHRSVGARNNERLEFLGDALVNLIVAELLYDRYPKAREGELTRLRARLVSELALAEVARELELGEQLRLGPGESKSGGHRRDSILADALEALVAAVYLDGGWDACRRVVREIIEPRIATAARGDDKDAKTRLQELLQAHRLALPVYALVATRGAEHAKIFEVDCRVDALALCTHGVGPSRRAAEQAAAAAAITLVRSRLAPGEARD